jgi:hypothetical protein
VDVAADGDRGLCLVDVGLFEEELFDEVAERADCAFFQVFTGFDLCYPVIDLGHEV